MQVIVSIVASIITYFQQFCSIANLNMSSSSPTTTTNTSNTPSNSLDVLVVGAGISGISAAYYLKKMCPNHSFAILEGRSNLGGTWDLFRYPGVRSDSDMHTLGFSFKPWTNEKTMTNGASVLKYLQDTAREFDIEKHICFNHSVAAANWSSSESIWTVTASNNGKALALKCKFLYMCSGYYNHKDGYKPAFPGEDRFQGKVVHPQKWPEDLDYSNKKVVVIGSGATAVTLVPWLAREAKRVTMLQRSPTYVVSLPSVDNIAKTLHSVLPDKIVHAVVKKKNIMIAEFHYKLARLCPQAYRAALLQSVAKEVGSEETQKNFTPLYMPWEQRVCVVPDGDLFQAIRSGKASVVTDTISSFTESGIELKSGSKLDADIIVTATGLQMVPVGGNDMNFTLDGKPVDFSSLWSYKGVAYSGVPNMAASHVSYVSKSWTLRAELTSQWVCKILNHMEAVGAQVCEPRLSLKDFSMTKHPFLTGFTPGYMQRIMPKLAKQGDCFPWMRSEVYRTDCKWLLGTSCDDGVMTFFSGASADSSGEDHRSSAGNFGHMGGVREIRFHHTLLLATCWCDIKLLAAAAAAAATALLAMLFLTLPGKCASGLVGLN